MSPDSSSIYTLMSPEQLDYSTAVIKFLIFVIQLAFIIAFKLFN